VTNILTWRRALSRAFKLARIAPRAVKGAPEGVAYDSVNGLEEKSARDAFAALDALSPDASDQEIAQRLPII
jgi:hypothetical protein